MSANERRVAAAYDTLAGDYARLLPDLRAENGLDRAMIAAFTSLVSSGIGGSVADLGCGTGRVTAELSRQGLRPVGFDVSAGMVAEAAGAHAHLPFAVGSLRRVPLASGLVAEVVSWYSVIHTSPGGLGEVFAEFARVLRPGGYLLVGFHVGGRARRFSRPCGRQVDLDAYDHHPDELAARVIDAGLVVHTKLVRAAEGREPRPQASIIALKPGAEPDA